MFNYGKCHSQQILQSVSRFSCAHYDSLPSECTLQKEAGKCCEEPVCTFNKQFGQFTGAGTVSGKGTGLFNAKIP